MTSTPFSHAADRPSNRPPAHQTMHHLFTPKSALSAALGGCASIVHNGDRAVTLTTGPSGWYVGNVVFGGLIGLLIVDPATGAMRGISRPTRAAAPSLTAAQAGLIRSGEGFLVVMASDISAEERADMVRIN